MSYVGPELLTTDHILEGFDCGEPALDEWLTHRSLVNQSPGTSRTWVVTDGTGGGVVAFYASSTASVLRESAPKNLRRNQPEELPAVFLGRLAVDSKHAGKGLGSALLKHFMVKAIEVAGLVGVRLLIVHAKEDETKRFYTRFGFVGSPVDPMALIMVLPAH